MSEIIFASVILAGTYTLWKAIDSRYRLKNAELNRDLFREIYEKMLPSKPPLPPMDPPPISTQEHVDTIVG